MAKNISRKKIDRAEYARYLRKAQDFYDSMNLSRTHGKQSPAASAGIHCAILAADACCIYFQGYKCSSTRHLDLVPCLEQLPLKEARQYAVYLKRALEVKSVVEYSGDHYTLEKSKRILESVEKFFRWVKTVLP